MAAKVRVIVCALVVLASGCAGTVRQSSVAPSEPALVIFQPIAEPDGPEATAAGWCSWSASLLGTNGATGNVLTYVNVENVSDRLCRAPDLVSVYLGSAVIPVGGGLHPVQEQPPGEVGASESLGLLFTEVSDCGDLPFTPMPNGPLILEFDDGSAVTVPESGWTPCNPRAYGPSRGWPPNS